VRCLVLNHVTDEKFVGFNYLICHHTPAKYVPITRKGTADNPSQPLLT
jgi:hypothetical protein